MQLRVGRVITRLDDEKKWIVAKGCQHSANSFFQLKAEGLKGKESFYHSTRPGIAKLGEQKISKSYQHPVYGLQFVAAVGFPAAETFYQMECGLR